MKEKAKKPRLAGVPAWALSLIAFFVPIVLFGLFENAQLPEPIDTDLVFIIGYVIFVTLACFFICKTHPRSVWYTPLICNGFIIFFVIKDAIFWDEWTSFSDWIGMVGIIVLSVIAAIIGAKIGRRRMNHVK